MVRISRALTLVLGISTPAWGWLPAPPEPDPETLAAARGLIDTLPISGNWALLDKAERQVSDEAQEWFDRTYGASNPPALRLLFILKVRQQLRHLRQSVATEAPDILALTYARRLSAADLAATTAFFETGPGRAYAAVVIAEDMLIVSTLAGRLRQAVAPTFPQLVDEARNSIAHMNAVNRANRKNASP